MRNFGGFDGDIDRVGGSIDAALDVGARRPMGGRDAHTLMHARRKASRALHYDAVMRRALHTLDAIWQLARLAVVTRGRLRGRYWHWRFETAFGTDATRMPSRWRRMQAMLRFGHWVGQMRRLSR
jgi:hypothetical protein